MKSGLIQVAAILGFFLTLSLPTHSHAKCVNQNVPNKGWVKCQCTAESGMGVNFGYAYSDKNCQECAHTLVKDSTEPGWFKSDKCIASKSQLPSNQNKNTQRRN